MKTKPRSTIAFLLLGAFLLAWAGTAGAAGRNIIVENVTVTVSSLNSPPLDGGDNITVRNGGTLWVDNGATPTTIGNLTIGDGISKGEVLFSATASVLVVTNDVSFGVLSDNKLDMAYITPFTAHQLWVGRNFLRSGSGSFNAGSATIVYYGESDQPVTARIGLGGAPIQYKDVILKGEPAGSANAIKIFDPGISINGLLDIQQKAKPQGSSATFFGLARLKYSGQAITASTAEWPTSMGAQVEIGTTVTLDSSRQLAGGGSYANVLVITSAGTLKDGGNTISLLGNIQNDGGIEGTGALLLQGSIPQTLSGSGVYGNVTVNNVNGVSLPTGATSSPLIRGRLSIQSGKITLPSGTSHHVSLLSLSGADQAADTYSATSHSGAYSGFFAGSGTLIVDAKPVPTVTVTGSSSISVIYGSTDVTVSGRVTPPGAPVDFAKFGNGAKNGEQVKIVVGRAGVPNPLPTPVTNNVVVQNGEFSGNFNTAGMGVGDQLSVDFYYAGGENLAAANLTGPPPSITVQPRPVTVIPVNVSKTYGDADPVFAYTYSPPDALIGGDYFSGVLARQPGENVGLYFIVNSSALGANLTIKNDNNPNAANNYAITFDDSKRLTINQKPVTVTIVSTNKIYGEANPAITVVASPALLAGDLFTGALAYSVDASTAAGTYPVTRGDRTITTPGFTGLNYAATWVSGNLVVDPRTISITFAESSKTYGNADPSLTNGWTVQPNGFTSTLAGNPAVVNGDQLLGKPARVTGETVAGSPYAITGSGSGSTIVIKNGSTDKTANYVIAYVPSGKLTVNTRPITVTAANPNRTYGQSIVALVNYAGFVTSSANPAGVSIQTAPANPPTVTWGAKGQPTSCSLPATYPYTINANASDPNHYFRTQTSPEAYNSISANYVIGAASLTIRAQNKSKVYDGNLFPYSGFTPTYSGFVCGDNENTALSGSLTYSGDATTAVDPGVYPITLDGKSTLDGKYNITRTPGYLSITDVPKTNTFGTLTWNSAESTAWMVNDPIGEAGKNPGWTLIKVTGALQINATSGSKFRLDLVTMVGNVAGRMAKFDPTRPYSWLLVDAGSISGFAANKFTINYDGSANGGGLFANPIFGGTFSLRQGLAPNDNKLFLDFTPVGAARDAAGIVSTSPSSVGTGYNVAPLLTDVTTTADLDTVYLSPNRTTVNPNGSEDVIVSLNVANLNQPIVGLNGYIKFDSTQFTFKSIEAGGGVWTSLIYFISNGAGDADVVVAVNLTASAGTSADATVAKLTLTPTRTSTLTSRVIFRADGTATVAEGEGTGVLTYLQPAQAGGAKILPARVMTPLITITDDAAGPTMPDGNITATQTQPSWTGAGLTSVDVKNGTESNRRQAVRTDVAGGTSGKVLIRVNASDAGVGLNGPPTVTRQRGTETALNIATTVPGKTVQPFDYEWEVGTDDADNGGVWAITVVAKDRKNQSTTRTFTVRVNTSEIQGVVELEGFAGTSRTVNFKTGDQVAGGSIREWNPSLTFTSGYLLPVGSFQNRAGMAAKIGGVTATSTDTVSRYLALGDILNVGALRDSLVNKQGGVSTWIHAMLYGYIENLTGLAGKLTSPNRSVDAYIISRLSVDTITKLAEYMAANAAGKAALAPALTTAILNDFNTVVLGGSIYNPVRFASVTLTSETLTALGGSDTVAINRNLLQDAYEYTAGQLPPATAQKLTQNDPALLGALLAAFDTIAISPSMWPDPTAGYGPCLYNEQVFLGVTLSSATLGLLTENPFPVGTRRTLLNQRLLEDAYPGVFVRAPLSPATVDAARNYSSPEAFESLMVADLNALIGGQSIYTAARFPLIGVPFDTSTELGALLAKTSPTTAERIRMNRLLLESAYSELSKGVLAQYRLVQVPSVTELTASTAWNLRVRKLVSFESQQMVTADFIGNGQPQWQSADSYLRGGDVAKDGDNQVTLADFFVLSQSWLTTAGGPADINGDGNVSGPDYTLMLGNWGMVGDAEVQ